MSEFLKAQNAALKQPINVQSTESKLNGISYYSLEDIETEYFNAENKLERYPLKSTVDNDNKAREQNSSYLIEPRFLSDKIRAAQKPSETMLELLMAFASIEPDTTPAQIKIDRFGQVPFFEAKQVKIRRVLFNNPYLEFFNNNNLLEEEEKWQQWGDTFIKSNLRELNYEHSEEELRKNSRHLDRLSYTKTKNTRSAKSVAAYRIFVEQDIAKLRQEFKSFDHFTKAVILLRSWAFISPNKQWCYNFLFPFGPDCLFVEITKDHKYSANYLSGAGLLVFNMMWRAQNSEHFATVCQELHQRFLNSDNAFNRLACKLEGRDTQKWLDQFKQDIADGTNNGTSVYDAEDSLLLNSFRTNKTSYLPYKQHRVFDQVTEDFYNLLTVKTPLNQQDLFNALSLICELNLAVYYLEICQTLNVLNGIDSNIDMVVECCHENGKHLRRLSTARLNENDDLLQQVVGSMMKLYLREMFPGYNQNSRLDRYEFNQIIEILRATFRLGKKFNQDGKAFEQCCEAESGDKTNLASFELLQKYLLKVVEQSGDNFNALHRNFCRFIGLTSKNHVRAYRYVLPDELVRVLVLTTVDEEHQLMLLDDFLQELYRKYHLVIGPKEGRKYFVSEHTITQGVEDSLFIANLNAFKEQLLRMGFLITLSDTASYIKNPYLD